jgi:hypothetical protein
VSETSRSGLRWAEVHLLTAEKIERDLASLNSGTDPDSAAPFRGSDSPHVGATNAQGRMTAPQDPPFQLSWPLVCSGVMAISMNALARVLQLGLLLSLGLRDAFGVEISLTERTVIEFADERRGAKELGAKDIFSGSLSPFDRAARMQTDKPVSQDDFLSFVSAQAIAWKPEETTRLESIIGSISNKIAPYVLNFPAKVLLVKTTGKEEGGAAYCRNNDLIVFPQSKLTGSSEKLEGTLIHELFHILSRNNPHLRDSLYEIVGFNACSEIELPEPLKPRKITNPDAPTIGHYVEVMVGDKTLPAVPVLFSNQASYDVASGKSFFAYLKFQLLVIERAGERWQPQYRENEPWLVDVSEVKGFHEKIGRNTGYIIHPEEVLADNFVHLVNGKRDLPTPQIIDKMRRLLSKP